MSWFSSFNLLKSRLGEMTSHVTCQNQLHSSEGSIDGERDFYFRRRVDLNSTACTSTARRMDINFLPDTALIKSDHIQIYATYKTTCAQNTYKLFYAADSTNLTRFRQLDQISIHP